MGGILCEHPSIPSIAIAIAAKQEMELIIRQLNPVGCLEKANFYVDKACQGALGFCIEWEIYRHCIRIL